MSENKDPQKLEVSSQGSKEHSRDLYEYNFENIFRLGLEQVLTHKRTKSSVLPRSTRRSSNPHPISKPKGLFLGKEKKKDVITLENRTARFTTYAPRLFQFIRDIQETSSNDLLYSLCVSPLKPLSGDSGKSGANFYVSSDLKFVIKTLTLSEKQFLLKILKSYSTHLKSNNHSLLSIFYGLFKITFTVRKVTEESWAPLAQRKIFVIMNNVFGKHLFDNQLEKFDLKGTTEERFVALKEDEDEHNSNKAVKKDINFQTSNHVLALSAVNRVLLTEQIRRDVEFLQKHKIMDYSFLVGLKVLDENVAETYKKTFERNNFEFDILDSRKIYGKTVFQLSGDGVVGEHRETKNGDTKTERFRELYLFGIIDILQPYNLFKKTAHQYKKQIKYAFSEVELDTVRPEKYAKRFLTFLNNIIVCKDVTTLSRKVEIELDPAVSDIIKKNAEEAEEEEAEKKLIEKEI